MDRRSRRFVPSSDGLEGRQLLSTATAPVNSIVTGTNPNAAVATSDVTTPNARTIEAKLHRIEALPYFLGLLNKDGAVPQPTVQNIQNDLKQLVGQLHPGSSSAASTFNLSIRKAQPYLTIRAQDAKALNRNLGTSLLAAGARPETVANLQADMVDLTKFATTQRNSRIVATNDYAIIGQLALEIGRPLEVPKMPNLLSADHQGNKGKVQLTRNHQPSLTGGYIVGTDVQIVDVNNQTVLGTGHVDPNTSNYTVQFTNPLADGTYTVRVRGSDSGYFSAPSPTLTFTVVTPVKK